MQVQLVKLGDQDALDDKANRVALDSTDGQAALESLEDKDVQEDREDQVREDGLDSMAHLAQGDLPGQEVLPEDLGRNMDTDCLGSDNLTLRVSTIYLDNC